MTLRALIASHSPVTLSCRFPAGIAVDELAHTCVMFVNRNILGGNKNTQQASEETRSNGWFLAGDRTFVSECVHRPASKDNLSLVYLRRTHLLSVFVLGKGTEAEQTCIAVSRCMFGVAFQSRLGGCSLLLAPSWKHTCMPGSHCGGTSFPTAIHNPDANEVDVHIEQLHVMRNLSKPCRLVLTS